MTVLVALVLTVCDLLRGMRSGFVHFEKGEKYRTLRG